MKQAEKYCAAGAREKVSRPIHVNVVPGVAKSVAEPAREKSRVASIVAGVVGLASTNDSILPKAERSKQDVLLAVEKGKSSALLAPENRNQNVTIARGRGVKE